MSKSVVNVNLNLRLVASQLVVQSDLSFDRQVDRPFAGHVEFHALDNVVALSCKACNPGLGRQSMTVAEHASTDGEARRENSLPVCIHQAQVPDLELPDAHFPGPGADSHLERAVSGCAGPFVGDRNVDCG